MKGTNLGTVKEVTDPARQEINKTQDRLDRINRILKEAKKAERVILDAQRR